MGERSTLRLMDVANYLLKYGLGGIIVAVIVVIVTGLVKSPLKKIAVAKAEEKGVDKEVFTRWLALIPLALAFVGAVVNVSAVNGWANPFLEGFDWKTTAVEAAAAWGVAVAFYENGSLFLKSLKGGNASSSGAATKATVAGTSKSVAKAKAKVDTLSSQLAKAQEVLINEEAEEKRKADAVAKAKADAEAAAQKAAAEAEAARLKAEQEAKAKDLAAKKAQLESLEKQREGLLKEINGNTAETIN